MALTPGVPDPLPRSTLGWKPGLRKWTARGISKRAPSANSQRLGWVRREVRRRRAASGSLRGEAGAGLAPVQVQSCFLGGKRDGSFVGFHGGRGLQTRRPAACGRGPPCPFADGLMAVERPRRPGS